MVNDIVKQMIDGMEDESVLNAENGDFIGEDGLIYCGVCKQRKQIRLQMPQSLYALGRSKVFRSNCKCEQERIAQRQKQDEFDEKMREIQRMRDSSMMDSAYREASFSRYKLTDHNRELRKLAGRYTNEFEKMYAENQGLLIYGPVGTGKSYTAACIANTLIEKLVPVVMTSFVRIMQMASTYKESEYLNMLDNAKLLILDDLGAERNTDYALEKVYNVIDSRSRVAKPMILTTNLELNDMLNPDDIRYKRIYDRILDTCYPIRVDGRSFRRDSAEQRFDRMRKFLNE